jgi:hypothetical protein
MPHINLLYPFWDDRKDGAFEEAAQRATDALRDLPPFQVLYNSSAAPGAALVPPDCEAVGIYTTDPRASEPAFEYSSKVFSILKCVVYTKERQIEVHASGF